MKLVEYTPDTFLVSKDELSNSVNSSLTVIKEKSVKETSKSNFFFCLGALISCAVSLFPSFKQIPIVPMIFVGFIVLLLFVFLIISATRWYEASKELKEIEEKDLLDEVVSISKKHTRYTALLVVCYRQSKTGEMLYLTEKKDNFLLHCNMNVDQDILGQRDVIINYFQNAYAINKNQVCSVTPLSDEMFFSIKPIHNIITQNGFIFYQVVFKKRAKERLLNHQNIKALSINEMEKLPDLMGRNRDVILALRDIEDRVSDSFEESIGPYHIIWNITKNCAFNCAICATKDDKRKELTLIEKITVLNNISSSKNTISMLDFAGGDPMFHDFNDKDGNSPVIQTAIHTFGEDRVSVTTTGRGIENLRQSGNTELLKLLKKCEITIDASHETLSENIKSMFSRNTSDYCNCNISQIPSISENLQHLVINVPLIDDTLEPNEVDRLIKKIALIRDTYRNLELSVQLIRLMPVGGFCETYTKEKYKHYNPISLAQSIKKELEKLGIKCQYHCSLRILKSLRNEKKSKCTMLERKLCIDCAGNLFSCSWGAYLPCNRPEENPFYLGNLVQSNLSAIMYGNQKTRQHVRIKSDLENSDDKPYCEAISWYMNQQFGVNNDPISKP